MLNIFSSLLQLWRLITNFMFFGTIGFNFLFNMIFTYRYCRMLEEGSFRGKIADFVFMFVFGGTLMTVSFSQCYFLFSSTVFEIETFKIEVWLKHANTSLKENKIFLPDQDFQMAN